LKERKIEGASGGLTHVHLEDDRQTDVCVCVIVVTAEAATSYLPSDHRTMRALLSFS